MDTELLYTLLFILLIPLIPAMLLYTFLPSKTAVDGPFKGLNIKLSGAFSGYFLLVLIAISISIMVGKSQNKKLHEQVNQLTQKLEETNLNYEDWEISGKVDVENPPLTTIFSNVDKAQPDNSGIFRTKVLVEKNRSKLNMLCFYHQSGKYKILNLNKDFPPDDVANYDISVDSINKRVKIKKTIAINSTGRSYTQ
jgi:hypothetical protein